MLAGSLRNVFGDLFGNLSGALADPCWLLLIYKYYLMLQVLAEALPPASVALPCFNDI